MNFRNVEYEFLYYIYMACHKLQFSIVSQIELIPMTEIGKKINNKKRNSSLGALNIANV